jgi:flagellar hook-length control protein FliK
MATADFTVNATQAAAEVEQAARVSPADVMNQIMSRVRTAPAEGLAELRITLRPEQLGDVSLRIATLNGVVTAMFVAESQRVREIIESNFNQLRDALEEQGVQVSDLSVSVGGDEAEERMNQLLQAQREHNQRNARGNVMEEAEEVIQNSPIDPMDDSTVNFLA